MSVGLFFICSEKEDIMKMTITKDNFETEVVKSEIPVLIDFYADWCGPCKMMEPVIEAVSEKYEEKMKFGKCNIDNDSELALKYRIMSIPAILIFKGEEVIKQSIGAISQAELESIIEEAIG